MGIIQIAKTKQGFLYMLYCFVYINCIYDVYSVVYNTHLYTYIHTYIECDFSFCFVNATVYPKKIVILKGVFVVLLLISIVA